MWLQPFSYSTGQLTQNAQYLSPSHIFRQLYTQCHQYALGVLVYTYIALLYNYNGPTCVHVFVCLLQHNLGHHPYTNMEPDPDIATVDEV